MGYIYVPRHDYQLGPGSGPTGKVDCTAHSASMAIDRATMGDAFPGAPSPEVSP